MVLKNRNQSLAGGREGGGTFVLNSVPQAWLYTAQQYCEVKWIYLLRYVFIICFKRVYCWAPKKSMTFWRLLRPEFLTSNAFNTLISDLKFHFFYICENHRTPTTEPLFLFKHPFPGSQLFSYTTFHIAVTSHSLSFLLL